MASVLKFGEYVGAVKQRRLAGPITVSCVEHVVPKAIPLHAHEAGFLSMLLSGCYREKVARREYCYDPFTSVFHPPGFEHCDRIEGTGARFFIVECPMNLFENWEGVSWHSVRDFHGGEQTWLIVRLLDALQERCSDFDLEAMALNVIFASVQSSKRLPVQNRCFRWAREYIEAYHRQPLTVTQVAGIAGVHPGYLGYLFRRESGQTIGQYLNRVRVRAAANALASSHVPLANIAAEFGFADQSHFTKVFKKITGTTPNAFRNRRLACGKRP